jgi:diguanylate cyclase (GGDEF)-like protein
MYQGRTIFVAGSAHLDVLARITGDDSTIDKIGRVTIEIGGTACNIATNLAALGIKPRLLTALQEKSPYSGIITAHLQSHGVDVRVVHYDGPQSAVFSAHIAPDGEMLSAVSSMPVEEALFDDDLIKKNMEGSSCAILECNLSGKTLNQFVRVANTLNIPVFLTAVSEEKSLRISDVRHPISAVFMNRKEATYFGRRSAATTSLLAIADRLACPLIVTKDKDGVFLVIDGIETHIPPIPLPENVQTLGAGDALLAATVAHHVLGQMDMSTAIIEAVKFTMQVIGKPNCNAGKAHAIEDALASLDHMATRDSMTKIYNRGSGEKIIANAHGNAISGGVPYSILIIDIDHFKKVNDTYGHDIGDEAIKAVAGVLSQTIRGIDAACRWGGEEFLCVLHGADTETAKIIAERIRKTIELSEIPGVNKITVSVGIGTWSETMFDYSQVIKTADRGLYEAKNNGRNRVAIGHND